MLKILNGKINSLTTAAVIIAATSLISRLLGLFRDRILASEFGAGEMLDVYYAAFRIPDLLFNLIVLGAISAGFIPLLTEYLEKRDQKLAWKFVNDLLNVMLLGLIVIAIVLAVFAPWIMKVITPGFDPEKMKLTVDLTRIMFLSPIFLGMSSILGGILQAHKRFVIYSITPIVYNLGIIFGAVFLVNYFGIYGLAIGVVLGTLFHFGIQIPSVKELGYKYKLAFDFNFKALKELGLLMIPRTLNLGILQINLVIMTIIASFLEEGSISVFNFANNLQVFPVGIFGVSFAIAAFPTLSKLALKKNKLKFNKYFSTVIRQILFFVLPAMGLVFIFRAQIVRLVLGAGNFDWQDTVLTINTLTMFTLSLFAQALLPLMVRAFYAFKNTIAPFIVGLISAGINIFLSIVLVYPIGISKAWGMGVEGIALAFSIANIFNLILLWLILKVKLGKLDEKSLLIMILKVSLATIGMAIVAQVFKTYIGSLIGTETFITVLVQAGIAGGLGVGVFCLINYWLKTEELLIFLDALKKRIFKDKSNYPENAVDESLR